MSPEARFERVVSITYLDPKTRTVRKDLQVPPRRPFSLLGTMMKPLEDGIRHRPAQPPLRGPYPFFQNR